MEYYRLINNYLFTFVLGKLHQIVPILHVGIWKLSLEVVFKVYQNTTFLLRVTRVRKNLLICTFL